MNEEYEDWNPAPSLVDLCINTAVDNLRHLGDVGETDFDLLRRILKHCTIEQLMHVEKSTKGRDLSPVTNELWMQFYQKEFGKAETNKQIEKMKKRKAACRWKKLYEEKQKERLENENIMADRLKRRYEEEVARKQSRQIQVCTKVPPSSKKRSWGNGGYNVTGKNNLMKKAKLDFLKSNEVRNLAAMKKNALPKSYSAHPVEKPSLFPEKDSASSSKQIRPVERTVKCHPF